MATNDKAEKTRVAVYLCIRGTGEHKMNLEMQKEFYTKYINKNPDWEWAGIYADVGTDCREQPHLKRLLTDCDAGLIDFIITKSVSRFSRNAVQAIETVKALADLKKPVGVYFETEGFNTLEKQSLVFLNILTTMAIEESNRKHERMPYSQYKSNSCFLRRAKNEAQ